MDFVLERMHVPERIVLESGKSYTCGRGKENTIICLGLQVSRQHCVFFHATDKLFVTDLKSSNGIFINGTLQEPYRMVQLHQDDIIGIGCADIEPDDTTFFVYKIYITRASDPTELVNTTDMSSTVPNCDTMIYEKQSNSDVQNGSRDKRGISPNNCDMPCKVPRYTDNNGIISNRSPGPSTTTNIPQSNNSEVNNVEVASDTSIHIKQENDVEIIHIFPESKDWDIKDHILKYETYLNDVKLKTYQVDDKMDFSVDENHKNNSESSKAMDNKHREKTNSFDKTNDKLDLKGTKFIYNNDQLIKLEDELQLTDEDEAAHVAVTNSKATCKKTPIKLKKIKHEPKTRFSEIDVVDLSDDEDGIFPYSQLFDIKYEDNVKQEMEMKQECVISDVDKIDPMDIDDEVIVLTDSEDDNPWLHRLSRSQLMNEDKKVDGIKGIIKDEIDLGIWQEDTSKLALDAIPSTSKDFNQVAEEESAGIDSLKDSACKETSLKRTSIDKRTIHNDNNDTDLPVVRTGSMDVDDGGPPNKSNLENTDITRQENDANQNVELRKHTETSPSANERYKSKYAIKRGIPLIEAPHLPSRRGRHKSSKNDSGKDQNKAAKTSEDISLSSSTTEENKMQKLKDKLENYNTEQSKEVSKDSSDRTVTSKQNRISISKEEKKIIIEERKAKLKKIAEEEKLAADNNKSVKRGTAKPRVKVSHKNRGDFLCNEEVRVSKPPSNKTKSERTKSDSCKANHTTSTREDDVPESVIHDIEIRKSHKQNIPRNKISNIATSSEESSLNNILDRIQLSEKYNDVNNSNMNNNIVKRCDSTKRKNKSTASTTNSSERTAFASTEMSAECVSVCNKENKISSKSVETSKKKKGVTFAANIDVKEFTTESESGMKKLVGKDAPIPPSKLSKTTPKLEVFLSRIFLWNPVWLEEQRYLKIEPPIVPEEELQNMKVHYESYMDYYDVMLPLLLLETWHSISKDFENVANNAKHKTAMCSIVANSIASTPIPTTEYCLTSLMLEVLVTREDLNRQSHPNFGDLVSFEYVQYAKGKQSFCKVFAYVTGMSQAVISDFTHYNRDLKNYVPNAYAVITYSVQTRPIEHEILLNRIHRVRTITYLRSNMRMVQALQYLPKSPVLDLILNPNIINYQLPPFNTSFIHTSLVTKKQLNPKQLEAVSRVTDVVVKNEAKLCFIQGPPGTGKSKVIVNLVAQILYGERENRNDKTKILLCAPSNAAIDEVVMRLLFGTRPDLKEKYNYTFNLVRIGRLENMHPLVKVVSPPELAKRHLRKFTETVLTWSVNSMTNYGTEKARLQVQIDECQAELNVANLTEARMKTIKRRLTEASVRYELLMSKQLFDDVNPKDRSRFQRLTEEYILARADIIACTLSSCYTNQMESIFGANKEKLSVCIVDEATQSCEAETLIPLMLGVNTMVLVGDPNQLPATILSQRAKKLGLDQSIFSRMQHVFMSETDHNPIIMLDVQYRMAYSISYWPNKYFYDGKLKNAIECRLTFPFQPYRVLCHNSMQNNDKFSNTTEAEFVANMIHAMFLYARWEPTKDPITLGILTPYNNQRPVILNKINEKISTLPENMKKRITYEVNTVDSFQGQERDVIIMSCVRSHGIGFLSDKQRLCVALTRAKHSLILCGNFNTFMKDQMWKSLLSDARSRGVLYDVDANASAGIIKQFVVK